MTTQPKKRKSKPNAFADHLREWESLLDAVADNAAELAPIEAHRAALAQSLERARQTKALQESHTATRQQTTHTLNRALVEGKDQVIRLRGAIRAELGPTTERLKQFGVHPLRRRPSRHKPDAAPTLGSRPEAPAAKTVREVE